MEHEGVWTIEELKERTVAELQELLRSKEIEPWQYGAAFFCAVKNQQAATA